MSSSMHFGTPFSFKKSAHILSVLTSELRGSSEIMDLVAKKDFNALLNYEIDYSLYSDPLQVIADRQILAFYQKNMDLPVAVDRKGVAFAKFLEAENQCRSTNDTIKAYRNCPELENSRRAALFFSVQRKISRILGVCPSLTELDFSFGPGANVGLTRFTSVRRKLSACPTFSTKCVSYIDWMKREFPHWDMLERAIPGIGKLSFVPKNAKTDRVIVIEPVINTFLQKGVGKAIRNRLLRAGCNLNSQTTNQKLALLGSRDGSLATIDLSSASDTISTELVRELLPHDWYSLLDSLRTPVVKTPAGIINQQKFSSMGNGFTFELESLIFFALCKSICDQDDLVSVYGDDIIVPVSHFDEVSWALSEFGFTLNKSKSFSSGLFRESCGKDFFGGIDVRPVYVKERLSCKELFRLHNFFVRNHYYDLASLVLQHIPRHIRIFGPDGYGDGHLLGKWIPDFTKRERGYGGYIFRTYQTSPLHRKDSMRGDYAAFLYLNRNGASETVASDTMYHERGSNRYSLVRVYTFSR